METIVLGFDGSPSSMVALDWVAERAAAGPRRVEVVMIGGTLLQDDFGRDAGLIEAERRLRDRAPDAEVDAHRFTGRMPDALLERARGADLLVIGSHRGRPLWSAVAAWMPLRVASRTRTALAVIPDDWPERWTTNAGGVVVGVDDDDSSLAAVDFAAAEAAAAGVRLTLVHTWAMPVPQMEGSVALLASPIETRATHRRVIRDAITRARAAHPDLLTEQIIEQTSPATALLRASRAANLLVLGTHHRTLFTGAVLGSTGQDVLSQAHVPVCVVPSARTDSV
ncbi:universal stress protein [Microbacterium lacus]|uniref:Universal stress protein n=1 Tax=Microbacterium lacus TaxID=415217 RepID=A0ABN2G4I9_9MICO